MSGARDRSTLPRQRKVLLHSLTYHNATCNNPPAAPPPLLPLPLAGLDRGPTPKGKRPQSDDNAPWALALGIGRLTPFRGSTGRPGGEA